jgi:hypothetical protein
LISATMLTTVRYRQIIDHEENEVLQQLAHARGREKKA